MRRARCWFRIYLGALVAWLVLAPCFSYALVLPAGANILRVGSAAILWTGTGAGTQTLVGVNAAVGGASGWGISTLTTASVGTILGYGVVAGLAGYAGYKAYQGWRSGSWEGFWDGSVLGAPWKTPDNKDILTGNQAGAPRDPNKLYVKEIVTNYPAQACWRSSCGGSFNLTIGITNHGQVANASVSGSSASAYAAADPAHRTLYNNTVTDGSGFWYSAAYVTENQSGTYYQNIWPYCTGGTTQTINYRDAIAADLARVGKDALEGANTTNQQAVKDQVQAVLADVDQALQANTKALYGNTAALDAIKTALENGLPQADWDALGAAQQALTPAQNAAAQTSGGPQPVELSQVSPWAQGQLVEVVKTGVQQGSPVPLTQQQVTQAHKDALAEDRQMRSSAVGITQAQTQTAVEGALETHRAAEETAAAGGQVPGAPTFDPAVVAPEEEDLPGLLSSIKTRLLALPFLSYVTGAHVTATGNPVVSCVVYGRTITMDFSKYEGVWDACGVFLLTATAIIWGRKMIGVE